MTDILTRSSVWHYAYNGLNPEGQRFLKQAVHSHFFYSPAPADFDIKTALAFIFPLKHFINETPQFGKIVYYNMDEEPCTAPQGGFISPALPGGESKRHLHRTRQAPGQISSEKRRLSVPF